MSDIFLSYASADRDKAQSLASVLSEKGWSVWWDRTIPPGKTFDAVIEEALNSARCVVVLWSRAAVSSDWVKTEAAEAARRGILIPALIEDVEIPLEFRRIQAADLSKWDAPSAHPELEKVLDSITGLIGQLEMPAAPQREASHLTKTFDVSIARDSVGVRQGEEAAVPLPSARRRWWKIAAAASAVAATVAVLVLLWPKGTTARQVRVAPAVPAGEISIPDADITEEVGERVPAEQQWIGVGNKTVFLAKFFLTWEQKEGSGPSAKWTMKEWHLNGQKMSIGKNYKVYFEGEVRNIHINAQCLPLFKWRTKLDDKFDRPPNKYYILHGKAGSTRITASDTF